MKKVLSWFNLLMIAIMLCACGSGATTSPETLEVAQNAPVSPVSTATIPLDRASATPSNTLTLVPSQTPTVTFTPTPIPPTATPTETLTPVPPTETPTATATPIHPLSIEWLRGQDFPGSEVVIEEILEPGPNYDRYIASYQSEGLKIFAMLTIPQGEQPETGWPVVIFNHGYIPPSQYRTTERYVAYVDAFARHGYIVFRSDYRGHGFSEGIPRGAYGNPDYTIDVLNAVTAMKNFPEADPNRIGMWGHSMGGYITLRAMVTDRDIKAGVIWAGVVASYPDLFSRWSRRGTSSTSNATPTSRRGWRDSLFGVYGSPEENPVFWDSISANSNLSDLSGPLQLHHGTADTSVPIEFSRTLSEQVKAVGKSVEYYEYEGDNHNISIEFSLAMQRSIQFFNIHVRGPAP